MKANFLLPVLLALLPQLARAAEPPPPSTLPFVDEFDHPHDWSAENPTWTGTFKDGRFIYENLNPNAGYLNWLARELPLANGRAFEILTRVQMLEGAPNRVAMIIWDGGSEERRRFFEISDSGKYRIYHQDKTGWINDHVGVPSALIRKTEDNDLAIRVIGSRAYYFINGAAVDVTDYPGLAGPWVGIVTPAGCTNSFDRFEVRYLPGTPEQLAADALKYESEAKAALIAGGPPLQEVVETFDDNNRQWENIRDGENWSARIAGGVLEWTNKHTTDHKQVTSAKFPINTAADYDLSFRLRHVAGATNVFVGLWWDSGPSALYQFGIAHDGWYMFGRKEGGKYHDTLPFTQSSLVKKEGFNDFRVRKIGSTFFLFINGQIVADTPAKSLWGDSIGLATSQGSTEAFDDIRVTYPKLTEQQTAAEKEQLIAALKAAHGKPGLGVVYSVAKQQEIISAQAKADMQRLEDERWKLTAADDKEMNKVRRQFDGKKMIALFGSWGRPARITQDGAAVYYNYKLVGRTQYYYWFQILKRGKQEEWLITNISFTDNPL